MIEKAGGLGSSDRRGLLLRVWHVTMTAWEVSKLQRVRSRRPPSQLRVAAVALVQADILSGPSRSSRASGNILADRNWSQDNQELKSAATVIQAGQDG